MESPTIEAVGNIPFTIVTESETEKQLLLDETEQVPALEIVMVGEVSLVFHKQFPEPFAVKLIVSPKQISNEVLEEGADHLFFFNGSAPTGTPYSVYLSGSGTTIKYLDVDANSRGIGLQTLWTAPSGQMGKSALTIELKHQPGTKNGSYTNNGETDIQVPFKLKVN